jgi:fumarate hydratase class II
MTTRIESDSIGTIAVPAQAYWGAQTQRSSRISRSAGRTHAHRHHPRPRADQAGRRPRQPHPRPGERLAEAIEQAAAEVAAGLHDDQFPLVIWQTGSGTQSNMNVNEVIAGRANEAWPARAVASSPVHPNDHVNRGQSSNDSFPTALHVAAVVALNRDLLPALDLLTGALDTAAREWTGIVKIGRTHLQDATPLTLGQEFSGYVQQLRDAKVRLRHAEEHLLRLAQGGTAVGTGLNAPEGFARPWPRNWPS